MLGYKLLDLKRKQVSAQGPNLPDGLFLCATPVPQVKNGFYIVFKFGFYIFEEL